MINLLCPKMIFFEKYEIKIPSVILWLILNRLNDKTQEHIYPSSRKIKIELFLKEAKLEE